MTHHEITMLLLGVGLLLATARLFGEVAKHFRQPSVIGEILAGVLLGPTIFGTFAPELQGLLYPRYGPQASAFEGLTIVSLVLFLLVAGLEVDLSIVKRQGKTAALVGFAGMTLPFVMGLVLTWIVPEFLGLQNEQSHLAFSLFVATALSISALPVVVKILFDLNIFRSDLGMIMVAGAIVNDLVGWLVFAIILAMMGKGSGTGLPLHMVMIMTVGFAVLMLTLGRWILHRLLPYLYAYASWPGGVLSFIAAGAFLFGAATEAIGIHAIFGGFLFGCAIGDSPHLRERTRHTMENFVSFVFVPLFFGSIGLKANFLTAFDPLLVIVICAIATISKVLGSAWGAQVGGMSRREAWAVGFGLNARGAMEIILGLLALQAGVIGERLFVALVAMALLTSMTSGALMERVLQRKRPVHLVDRLSSRHYVAALAARTREEAIRELCGVVAPDAGIPANELAERVWKRELVISTGIGNSVAVPHARLEKMRSSLVAVGCSPDGIDFDAPDGKDARLIFLILTSDTSYSEQLEILADIGRTFQNASTVEKALEADSFAELLALIKVESGSRVLEETSK